MSHVPESKKYKETRKMCHRKDRAQYTL